MITSNEMCAVDDLLPLARELITRLKSQRALLCTVESCTGGLLASRLTDVSGASEVYWGGMVTYDNTAKQVFAGVAVDLLTCHGAVSAEVASAMAEGGLARMKEGLGLNQARPSSDLSSSKIPRIAIATTGIAGPTGGTPQKPVGLCFLGLARAGHPTQTLELRGDPQASREQLKNFFARNALEMLLQLYR